MIHPILRLRLRVCSPSTSKAEAFSLLRCRPEAVQPSLGTTTPKPSLGHRCSALLWCGQTQVPETPRVYPGVSSTFGIVFPLELQGCATTPNANHKSPETLKPVLRLIRTNLESKPTLMGVGGGSIPSGAPLGSTPPINWDRGFEPSAPQPFTGIDTLYQLRSRVRTLGFTGIDTPIN